jgi:hypothetical protein
VNGSGKNRSESFVFVVPRSGEGPESPVVVFANTTGNRIYDSLTSLGRVTFKGSRLGIPPWLTSTGIPCAISESGGDLESVLAPRELLCLAHAAESGFNMVEITGAAVILTVAENQYAAAGQLDFAKRWLP